MEFVHPEFLWLLFLLLIPIVIHLFHFRRHKTLFFPSLKFLKYVQQEQKSTQKLKHLLVLFSRLLAMAFLIICFAQPFIGTSKSNSAGKSVLAIYIDNSFSMTSKGTEGELLSEAKELTRRILKEAEPETHILLATNKLDGIEQRLITKVEALDYLEKIESTPIRRNLQEVLNWQKEFIDRENQEHVNLAVRQYVFLSDFQKNQFETENLKVDEKAFYYPIQITPQEISNLLIDSVWFASPIHKKGEPNEFFVQVKNLSENDIVNAELSMQAGSQKRTLFIDIPAQKSAVANFQITNNQSGLIEGKVSVNDKQLFWDDDFYFSYNVAASAGVLILNGDNASPSVNRVYAIESFYNVKSISDMSFTREEIKGTDLIVMNGLNEISSGLASELVDFKNQGGSIFIFPGSKINSNDYGNFLNDLGLPTLSGVAGEGTKIDKVEYKDPFFKNVFEKENSSLNLPSVTKCFGVPSFRQSTIFPLITLRNGSPLLLRTNESVYLFTSSLNSDFGNFTENALFPTVLLRAGEFSKRNLPLYATIGKENKLKLFEELTDETPLKLVNKTFEYIPIVSKNGLVVNISISGPEAIEKLKSGNYVIKTDSQINGIALNYDRAESEMIYVSKANIESNLKEQGVKNINFNSVENGQSVTMVDLQKPKEYWRLFLLLALLCVLGEMALLRFWK
ncbi:MAG: BatA domain-containing protein [Bacteroidota bacterium]